MKFEKIFDYEERLVRLPGETALFAEDLPNTFTSTYYRNQIIRSSGSSVLNYGEAQGTVSNKDFVYKVSIIVKELKETRGCLKVLNYLKLGNIEILQALLNECEELIAIGVTLIKNKKATN